MYVGENKVYGIWFNGQYGVAAAWILGEITSLAYKSYHFGWASSHRSCPSLTKIWREKLNNEWLYSTTAIVECLSGYNGFPSNVLSDFKLDITKKRFFIY